MLNYLGHSASYYFGRSQALDNIIEQDRAKEMHRLEAAKMVLSLEGPTKDEAIALGEIMVVQRFAEVHGAKDQSQMMAIEASAPPEPLALKLLDRLMDEEIDDPPPKPPEAQISDG